MILTKLAGAPKLVPFPAPASLQVRDERILAHLHLVDLVAKSLARKLPPCFELDDLKGAGNIGLLHAAERYQPSRKVPFERYARRRIGDAIRDSIRRRNWRDATQLELEAVDTERLVDQGELPDQAVQHSQDGHAIMGALEGLPARERAVIHLVYVRGETLDQVSVRMGVHRTRVHQLRKKAERRMRQHFALRGRTAA